MRKIVFVSAILVLLLFPAVNFQARVLERVAGVIEGKVYTLNDLEEAASRFGLRRPKGENPLDEMVKLERFYKEVMDRIVEEKVLERTLQRIGKDVKDEEVQKWIEGLKKKHKVSDKTFVKELHAQGFTLEGYRAYIKNQMRKARVIDFFIRPKISPDEEALLSYYRAHIDRYTLAPKVRLSHIFISLPPDADSKEREMAEGKIEKALEALRMGRPFSEVATLYSEDPSAKYGGDLGYLEEKEIDESLREIIRNLEVGEVSPIVRTSRGLHLLMVTDRRGGKPLPFEKVRSKVMEGYYKEEISKRYAEWLKKAKEKLDIEVRL